MSCFWDDETNIKKLAEYAEKGMTSSEIEAEFEGKVSCAAIIAKARRIGHPLHRNIAIPMRVEPAHDLAALLSKHRNKGATVAAGIELIDLEPHHCRWPLGPVEQRPPYRFCGAPPVAEHPYCQHHIQLAYPSKSVRDGLDKSFLRNPAIKAEMCGAKR